MKLTKVRIKMFRNILDSTNVSIQPEVTCLVGKNESGKTAFLEALYSLFPARLNPQFSVPEHYPAWLEKKHRQEGKVLEDVCPVEAEFVLEPADIEVVEKVFHSGVIPESGILRLRKTYNNELCWELDYNEEIAIINLLKGMGLPNDIRKRLKTSKTFDQLAQMIEEEINPSSDNPKAKTEFESVSAKINELLGDMSFENRLWEILKPRIPRFFYFSEYSKLPYSVNINHVLKPSDEGLSESELTARALLRLGGAENEYLLNPDYERRKRELENVSNALTEDTLRYWSQNKKLRVQPEITQKTERRPDGQHTVLDELKVRIWDDRHSLSLPFDKHSAGFQWFFSFLAAFSEYERRDPPVIILLDEPALGLHAKAQADFLRFIEERLTKRCQVIYTTHSPFMIQPGKLERVRLVEDRGTDEGAVVSSEVFSRDRDTLFPLQGALGYDLVQHLFVAENNIVVEGTSDYAYLKVVSDFLATKGCTSLDPKWSIVPVGGADLIPTFVALLGNHLKVTVLVDSRREGIQRLYRMASDGYLEKQRIILIGDILGCKAGDIEDLFEVEEYLTLYNKAFSKMLKVSDLQGNDPIVMRIARHEGVDRFDHGRPADVLLRERDMILETLSENTLKRFEDLFSRINKTLGS